MPRGRGTHRRMGIGKPKNRAKNDTEIGIMYDWKQKNCDPPSWDELLTHSEAVRAYAHQWDRDKSDRQVIIQILR